MFLSLTDGALAEWVASLKLDGVPDSTFQYSEFRSCRSSGAKESGIPAEILPGRCLSRISGKTLLAYSATPELLQLLTS